MAGEIASAFVRIRPNMTGFQAETESGVRKAFSGVGKIVTGAFAAVGAVEFGKHVVDQASQFQSQLLLIKTQAGASQQELQKMNGELLKMAPAVGQTPTTLAQGLYHIESAGLHGAKALDVLHAAAEGAAVGHADLESVTNALVAATKSHIDGITSQTQAMGVLNAIVGAGNMRMQDLTDAMSSGILPAAHTFGVAINDMGAALGVMTDAGVPAIDASTRLRMTLSLLGAPTSAAAKELAKIGISQSQLAETMRSRGLLPALQELKAHLDASGLSATKQAALLSAAFGGGRSSSAILTLIGNLGQYQQKLDQINQTTGNFGKAWEDTQKSSAFAFAQLKSTLSTIEVEIGAKLLPIVDEAAQYLSKNLPAAFSAIGTAVSSLDLGKFKGTLIEVKNAIVEIVGAAKTLTDDLGGLKVVLETALAVMAVGKIKAIASAIMTNLVEGGFRQLQVATVEEQAVYLEAFGSMEIATIGLAATIKSALISTGIGALVVAVGLAAVEIINHWNTVKSWIVGFGKWISDHAEVLLALPVIGQIAFMAVEVIKHWKSIKTFVVNFAKDIAQLFTHPIAAIENMYRDLSDAIEGIFKAILGKIADLVSHIPHLPGWIPGSGVINGLSDWGKSYTATAAGIGANAGDALGRYVAASAAAALEQTKAQLAKVTAIYGNAGSLANDSPQRAAASVAEAVRRTAAIAPPKPTNPYEGNVSGAGLGGGAGSSKAANAAQALANQKASLEQQFRTLEETAKKLGSDLSKTLKNSLSGLHSEIGGIASKQDVADARLHLENLRKEVTDRLSVLRTQISLSKTFDGLKKQVGALGTEISPELAAEMAKIKKEIESVSASTPLPDVEKVKSQMTKIKSTVSDELAALKKQISLTNTFQGVQDDAAKLGTEVTPEITAAMERIRAEISKVTTAQQQADVKRQLEQLKTVITSTLDQLKNRISADKSTFDTAWSRLASGVDAAFDKATQSALAKMQVTVTGAFSSFQFGGTVTTTPAELALQQLTDAHDKAAAAAQLAADQTAKATAVAAGDTAAAAKADAAIADDLYNAKVADLTKEAQAQRDAATSQLQAAQDAYSAQRDLLKQQLDDRVAAIQQGMLDGTVAAKDGMDELTGVLGDPKYGIDLKATGLVLGGELYAGISDGLKPVFDLFKKLAAEAAALGYAPSGNALPTTAAPPTAPPGIPADAWAEFLSGQKTLQQILDELKKQTDQGGSNVTVNVVDRTATLVMR